MPSCFYRHLLISLLPCNTQSESASPTALDTRRTFRPLSPAGLFEIVMLLSLMELFEPYCFEFQVLHSMRFSSWNARSLKDVLRQPNRHFDTFSQFQILKELFDFRQLNHYRRLDEVVSVSLDGHGGRVRLSISLKSEIGSLVFHLRSFQLLLSFRQNE